MPIYFLGLLLFSLIIEAEPNGGRSLVAPLHRYLSQRTELVCSTDEDCFSEVGYEWCQSGIFCHPVDGHCHLIPYFPCERGEVCHSERKTCERRQCRDWRDCNTESFCQGIERCVASECRLDPLHSVDCSHGHCSEELRACITPLSLVNESLRVKNFAYNMRERGGSRGSGFSTMDNHTNATPTGAPTEAPVTNTYWIFIGILAGVLAVIIVVAIISAVYKPVTPVVVFDKTTPDDSGLYTTQTFYNRH